MSTRGGGKWGGGGLGEGDFTGGKRTDYFF